MSAFPASSVADPAFLNRLAWNLRWSDRARSASAATCALGMSAGRSDGKCQAAQARRTLAFQAKWRGDFDAAMEHALECESLVTESAAPDLRGECYSILGVVHYSRHRMDLARHATERGLGLRNLPDATWIDLMTTKATIQRYSGHVGKAGVTLMRAREKAQGAELARVEHNLARWQADQDDAEGALKHAQVSIELSDEHQNRVILPYACEVAGSAAAGLKESGLAGHYFRRGIDLAVEDDDMRVLCQLLHCSAAFETARGRLDEGLDQLTYGARIAADMTYPLWQKRFALALAEVLEAKGDLKGAVEAHKAAWTLQKSLRDDGVGAGPRSD